MHDKIEKMYNPFIVIPEKAPSFEDEDQDRLKVRREAKEWHEKGHVGLVWVTRKVPLAEPGKYTFTVDLVPDPDYKKDQSASEDSKDSSQESEKNEDAL